MKKYCITKIVKDPYGENWRWLFGKWVYRSSTIFLTDCGDKLMDENGVVYKKIAGHKYVAIKRTYFFSNEKNIFIYPYSSELNNELTPNYEKGFPPINMIWN